MRAAAVIALVAALGCSKPEGEPPQSEPATSAANPSSAPAPQPLAPASVPAPATKAEKLVLDASKARAYVGYQEKFAVLVLKAKQAMATQEMAELEMAESFDSEQTALRKEFALEPKEIEALNEIQGSVLLKTSPALKALHAQALKMEAMLGKVPAASRAEAEKTLADMKAQQAEAEAMKEVREKYGDAIVDAMVAQEAKLIAVAEKLGIRM